MFSVFKGLRLFRDKSNNLAEGKYTVEIGAEYYESPPKHIEVGNNQNAVANFKLESLLDVKVTAEPRIAKQGENVTYIITVTNKGEDTATGIILSDVLPDGTNLVVFQALDGGNCSAETISCTLPDLTPGATATVKLVLCQLCFDGYLFGVQTLVWAFSKINLGLLHPSKEY